jgi:RNA polymerase sigma factor (sigma-70 family)
VPQHQYTSSTSAKSCLLDAVRRGDQAAWRQLVERHTGLLWAIARVHRLDRGDAADVVQTSWLRLIEHLPEISNPDAVGAWLATTARRECLRTLRSAARCQPFDAMDDVLAADTGEIDASMLREERDACVRQAFARLPAGDQALLRLLTLDPAPSYREISAALGMPVGSIGPTRGRALERLRKELEAVEAGVVRDRRQ